MPEVNETVSVPQGADIVANALVKLYKDLAAAKAAGLSGVALITSDVSAAIQDLSVAIPVVGQLGDEAKADPFGVAEALVIVAFKMLRGK